MHLYGALHEYWRTKTKIWILRLYREMKASHRGIVQDVCSGDSLVIRFLPPCKDAFQWIALENIKAPRFGSNTGSIQDEPHGFDSFDFTRKLCIGKRVLVSMKNAPSIQTRSHSIFGQIPVYFNRVTLVDSDNADLGMEIVKNGWAKVKLSKSKSGYIDQLLQAEEQAKSKGIGVWSANGFIRKLPVPYNSEDLLNQKDHTALVDGFINATTLALFLLPNYEYLLFHISSLKSSSAKTDKTTGYGYESREFIALKLLKRVIKIRMYLIHEGEHDTFIGIILGKEDDAFKLLLKEGYARIFLDYRSKYSPYLDDYLRAENEAKLAKVNMWKDYIGDKPQEKRRFSGTIISILDSHILEVIPDEGKTRWVHLNNIKAPAFEIEPYGWEAREYLRKKYVGKRVDIEGEGSYNDFTIGTAFCDDQCINVEICRKGLAKPASSILLNCDSSKEQEINEAGKQAKAEKIGIYSSDPLPDIMQMSSYFQTLDKEEGIIEGYLHGSRFIVSIPSKKVTIRVGLHGIIPVESNNELDKGMKKYCQFNFSQRDIELDFVQTDRTMCVFANVRLAGTEVDLAIDLLEHGFATVSPKSSDDLKKIEAQDRAKEAKVGLWMPPKEELVLSNGIKCIVTCINDSITYTVQLVNQDVEKIKSALQNDLEPFDSYDIGSLVAVKVNDMFYRGKVKDILLIELIDYGIEINIRKDDIYKLPQELCDIDSQAKTISLAYLNIFDSNRMDYLVDTLVNKIVYIHCITENGKYFMTNDESIFSPSLNVELVKNGIAEYSNEDIDGKCCPPKISQLIKNTRVLNKFDEEKT